MAHKHARPRPHAEFRHRSQIPMPAVEAVEQRLLALLSPSLLAPRQMERHDPRQPQRIIRMRQRLLTLPVMVAIVVSLVWRRMPAVTEVQRVLAREGLLWVTPVRVSLPRPHQTARCAASSGDGPALCRGVYTVARPGTRRLPRIPSGRRCGTPSP